jgi:hypothetical protein
MSTAGHSSGPQQPCTARTKRGEPCRAFALPRRPTCAVHDPQRAAAVQAARSRGGQVRALQRRRRKLDTPRALVQFTGMLIHDVLDGSRDIDVVRCALYGLSLQRQLLEASDLEQRLAALEQAAEARGQQGGRPWVA